MLTAVNELKQTPLDVIEARLSAPSSSVDTDAKVEALRRCAHLLQLAMDASAAATGTTSGIDCAPPAFLTSTSAGTMTTRELATRKQLLEALDDFESVRWGAFVSRPLSDTSAAIITSLQKGDSFRDEDEMDEEDGLSRVFRETLAGALNVSDAYFGRMNG